MNYYEKFGESPEMRKKLISTKILAIDEISMIPADIFDLLNNITDNGNDDLVINSIKSWLDEIK